MQSAVVSEVRVFRRIGVELAESPFFSGSELFFTDIPTGVLHVCPWDGAADGSDDRLIRFPAPLASIYPAEGGGFVAALADRVILADADGREVREIGRVTHPEASMRLNEGKVDPQGRFVVGSLNADHHAVAAWYRSGDDGLQELFGGITTSNGLEWSLDERHAYFTDTGAQTISRAAWDPRTGPGPREAWHEGGRCDGMAIDDEGFFWDNRYGEGVVVRIDPDGNDVERVEVPCPNIGGLCFGGPDGSTVFVGGATENMSDADLARYPHAGDVFAFETSVHGVPVRRFRP